MSFQIRLACQASVRLVTELDTMASFVRPRLFAFFLMFAPFQIQASEICFDFYKKPAALSLLNGSPYVGVIPQNVRSPIEIAKYLKWVRLQIPDLYANTRDYPVNFWSSVYEQNNVQDLFKLFPEYHDYLKSQESLLVSKISVKLKEQPTFDFTLLASEAHETLKIFDSVEMLEKRLKILVASRGSGSARGILNDLIGLADKVDKEQLRENVTIESLTDYFRLHEDFLKKFKSKAYDLALDFSLEQLQNRFHELKRVEDEIDQIRRTLFFKENEKALISRSKQASLLLDSVPKGDLKNALARYRLKPSLDEISIASAQFKTILIKEQPASLAMWKGCVGVDCTPSRFAFLPTERAFFIYSEDKPNNPKGYLSAAIVNDESGQSAFYLKQFQGPHLSPLEMEAMLMKAPEIASSLGISRVIIEGNTHSNYPALRTVWNLYVDRTKPEKIVFTDSNLRELIEPQKEDPNGVHHSEAMMNISEAYAFVIPSDRPLSDLHIESKPEKIKPTPLPNLSPIDNLEAGIAYARYLNGKTQGETAYVFYQLGLNQKDVQAFVKVLENPTHYTELEFRELIVQLAKTRDGQIPETEALARLSYIFDANKMRFKDSFSAEKEQDNISVLIQKVRKLRNQPARLFKNFVFVENQKIPGLKNKILSLVDQASDPDDFKVVSILLSFLNSDHLDPEFTRSILTSLKEKKPKFRKENKDEVAQSIADYRQSCIFDIINLLYSNDKNLAREVIKAWELPWKMGYFIEFNKEIRSSFIEFRNAVLWNLKTSGQNRWWVGNKVDFLELATLIVKGQSDIIASIADDAFTAVVSKAAEFCKASTKASCIQFRKDHASLIQLNSQMESKATAAQLRDLVRPLLMSLSGD